MNLQDHISTQTDLLTKLVYNAEIDEKSDISLYFYNLPTTLKRRNKYLQPSNTNENFINLPTEAFDGPFVVPGKVFSFSLSSINEINDFF